MNRHQLINTSLGKKLLRSLYVLTPIVALITVTVAPVFAQKLDTTLFREMKVRSIGPAGMSGRIAAIDAVHSNPDIIYAGSASGGLWKSTSGGIDWMPIFDNQPVGSIGAIAINQQNPDVVWVGTGEGNPRNSQASGNGVYKSLDGGRTWKHLGLDETRNIHRLVLHPTNPNVAYAGVIGSAWGDHPQRGVYRTTDGGDSWDKILYNNDRTGAADLIMDPSNPNKLIAAMWEYRRWPWFFESGGDGSGLYVTVDGGETWEKRSDEDGLPKGDLGRIGLAIARSNPDVVYALVEAKKNALYRSVDGGYTWVKQADKNIGNRPFYYAEIHVDPSNENRVYNLYSVVDVSEDGGKTFENLIPYNDIHPDHHSFWIHPSNPEFIIEGNDGGLAISRDRGDTWRFVTNLPLAQFYHIRVDMDVPYNVYGGMQDNGSWRGPSSVWRRGGIRNSYWEEVAFGDGFDVVPDPSNPRYGYAMSQGGGLVRYDLVTGYTKTIKPVHPEDVHLRFNWNAGIAPDPFNTKTIYYGSQFVHKSVDRGDSWTIISPDLTTNDSEKQKQLESGGLNYDVTQAENFTTIVAISPSPLEEGLIWVGTDDGNVQLTRDGGESWTNTSSAIRGVAPGSWVTQIHASLHKAGEAFVVIDDHRRNNWEPYIFRTTDYGRRWTRMVDGDDVWGFALSIVQDPIEPNLFFAGTEFGLFVSVDDGEQWTQWGSGYPTASTIDLVIHPRDHDLVIGTFGRAAFVLDDIRPLRSIATNGAGILAKTIELFPIPDAWLAVYRQATGTRFAGNAEYAGENRSAGAMFSYVLNPVDSSGTAIEKDSVTVQILDLDGELLRTIEVVGKKGINRMTWGLEKAGIRRPGTPKPKAGAPEPGGQSVLPGTYVVRMIYGDAVSEKEISVLADPRMDETDADRIASHRLQAEWDKLAGSVTMALDQLDDASSTISMIKDQLQGREEGAAIALRNSAVAVTDSIKVIRELFEGKEVQGIRRDPMTVRSRLFSGNRLYRGAPDDASRIALEQARKSVSEFIGTVNEFFSDQWTVFRAEAEAAKLTPFKDRTVIRMDMN